LAHDPHRHISGLVQALSQDKRPIALLVGAGCPVSIQENVGGLIKPLIPAVAGLTTSVGEAIAKGPHSKPYKLVVDQLAGDGAPGANVEQVLTRIRALAQVAGSADARGLKLAELDALDREICELIAATTSRDLPVQESGYLDCASWIQSTNRAFPIEIFTTNYDLLFEQAFERLKVPYFDGFIGSDHAFFDLHAMEDDFLPPRWTRLWKLHGSLNWYSKLNEVVRTAKASAAQRRVIHPSHLKYDESRKMPYLAMTDRLRAFLRQPAATIVTVGYSFGDQHINSSLVDGLRGNPSAIAFGLLFESLGLNPAAKGLAENRPNLCLLARDQAVVGGKADVFELTAGATSPPTTTAITWEPAAGAAGAYRPSVGLGDFKVFGKLCRGMIGVQRA
jgi:hypothetical protein